MYIILSSNYNFFTFAQHILLVFQTIKAFTGEQFERAVATEIQESRTCLRNKSGLAVNCWVIIHCLEVSCKGNQITSASDLYMIYMLTTDRQTVNYCQIIHALELIFFDSNTQQTLYPSDYSNFLPWNWRDPAKGLTVAQAFTSI